MKTVKIEGATVIERFVSPQSVVGESLVIQLVDGGKFYFKATGCREDKKETYISGYDEEMLNLSINVKDIDFVRVCK